MVVGDFGDTNLNDLTISYQVLLVPKTICKKLLYLAFLSHIFKARHLISAC